MKKLLTIILTAFSCVAFAQKPFQGLGAKTNIVKVLGELAADSALLFPKDTIQLLSTDRAIAFKGNTVYQWRGSKWDVFLVNSDTLYVDSPLRVRLDTATGHKVLFILKSNGLESGGLVTKEACLQLGVSPAVYNIGYRQFTTAAILLTVATPSGSFPRTDEVVADTTGAIYILTGIPSTTPVPISINPSSQIVLSTYTVAAGASCLGILQKVIYDQDTTGEFTHSTSGTITANFSDVAAPKHLTKDIAIPSYRNGSSITFTDSGVDTVQVNEIIQHYFYFLGAFKNQIQEQWFNGSTPVSNSIVINPYFNPSDSNRYIGVPVPFSAWKFSSPYFNKLVITFAGDDISGLKGMYMDYIQLQTGMANVVSGDYVDSTKIISGVEYYYKHGIGFSAGPVGGSGGSGLQHVVAGFGLLNVNDSTLKADTVNGLTSKLRGDSLKAAIAVKLNTSDTTAMLAPYHLAVKTPTVPNDTTLVFTDLDGTPTSYTIRGGGSVITNPFLAYVKVNGTTLSYTAQIPAATDISGTLGVTHGGTNNASLSVTPGTIYYGDGSKLVGLAPGTSRQHLTGGTTLNWRDTSAAGGNDTSYVAIDSVPGHPTWLLFIKSNRALPPDTVKLAGGNAGTVTAVSSNTPVLVITNPTTTPILDLGVAGANEVLRNNLGNSAAPSYGKLSIKTINATGTPSANTVLAGDSTWKPIGINPWSFSAANSFDIYRRDSRVTIGSDTAYRGKLSIMDNGATNAISDTGLFLGTDKLATFGNSVNSPAFSMQGNLYRTDLSASHSLEFFWQVLPTNGTADIGVLGLYRKLNGGAPTLIYSVNQFGGLTANLTSSTFGDITTAGITATGSETITRTVGSNGATVNMFSLLSGSYTVTAGTNVLRGILFNPTGISATVGASLISFESILGDARFNSSGAGSFILGGTTADASAILDVQSTSRGALPFPRMTTAQRNKLHGLIAGTITAGGTGSGTTVLLVALTGGSGTGATANITRTAGVVTGVAIASSGSGYVVGDILGASGYTGFTYQLSSVAPPAEGLTVSDITLHKAYYWDGSTWTVLN